MLNMALFEKKTTLFLTFSATPPPPQKKNKQKKKTIKLKRSRAQKFNEVWLLYFQTILKRKPQTVRWALGTASPKIQPKIKRYVTHDLMQFPCRGDNITPGKINSEIAHSKI